MRASTNGSSVVRSPFGFQCANLNSKAGRALCLKSNDPGAAQVSRYCYKTLADANSFTLVASSNAKVFRRVPMSPAGAVRGELRVNPLYAVDVQGNQSVLTLTFPNEDYESEFEDFIYKKLGVPRKASDVEIKKALRSLSSLALSRSAFRNLPAR